MTKKQLELKSKHGTPAEYEQAVRNALGEITWKEYQESVQKYQDEWNRAGKQEALEKSIYPL